jgi:hypothetical protein
MQCSSVGCSLAQWKNILPWRPKFGPEGKDLCIWKYFFFVWGEQRSCEGWSRWALQRAQKDGCAQRTGAHARPKPTSTKYVFQPLWVICHAWFRVNIILLKSFFPDSRCVKKECFIVHLFYIALICASTVLECSCSRIYRYVAEPPLDITYPEPQS